MQKTVLPWKETYDQPRYNIEKQRHYFAKKGPSSQGYGFSCGHVCERVTGRKARGLQMEEIACKCQTFLSLKRQEEIN